MEMQCPEWRYGWKKMGWYFWGKSVDADNGLGGNMQGIAGAATDVRRRVCLEKNTLENKGV
jgi:hypothetical protein